MSRQAALERAKRSHPTGHHVAVRRHPVLAGLTDSIHCMCGTQTAGWVVDDRLGEQRQVGPGQFVRHERMVFGAFPPYQVVEITFTDGSKHLSHGCRECLQNLREDTIERLYSRDLAEMARLEREDPARCAVGDEQWAHYAHRTIASWRLMEG